MRTFMRVCLGALMMVAAAALPAGAADEKATVKVALLDMSSVMPMGMMGYGMMGPGMMGSGMMGQGMAGQGMMMGGMMSLRADKATVKAGPVAFEVTNWSRSVLHEMLIVAVESPAASLPYDYGRAQVAEEQVKVLAEAADLKPNAAKTVEVALEPGAYLLICNVPGHYAAGMAAALTVVP